MILKPAIRVAGARCAEPDTTVRRLERALAAIGEWRYTERAAAPDLHWGALESPRIPFPAMGKGATPLLCKAATLAETVEWLAVQRVRTLPGHREGTPPTDPAPVPIEDLLAHIASASTDVLRRVKALPRARHWVEGFRVPDGEPRAVPLEYVHAISGTNGLASGNCIEEAILQGALEVFERRAAITVARQRLVMPTIDETTIDDAQLLRQLTALRMRGVQVTLKDFTFGGVLPCYAAYLRDPSRPAEFQSHHVLKVGASFDPVAALSGCLAEYAQTMRLGETEEAAADGHERLLTREDADNFLPLFWFGYVPWRDASFLADGDRVPLVPAAPVRDVCDDIARASAIAGQLGRDFLAVDLTDPAIAFPVVQIVMPGYSDILPYHPRTSPVLFTGWTRDLSMGETRGADGNVRPCPARAFFPGA